MRQRYLPKRFFAEIPDQKKFIWECNRCRTKGFVGRKSHVLFEHAALKGCLRRRCESFKGEKNSKHFFRSIAEHCWTGIIVDGRALRIGVRVAQRQGLNKELPQSCRIIHKTRAATSPLSRKFKMFSRHRVPHMQSACKQE